ncbi:MAG: hypothetical protein IT352_00185 [Gemmatimonadales bacterium]|nr:hypothetical protein [Gemmatimonadales bacterium]
METRRDTEDGVVVGVLAFAAVAAFYSLFDSLAARGPLFTVNLLGRAVFRGLRDPAVLQYPVAIDPGAIMRYNFLHLGLSLLIGLIVVRLVGQGERDITRARTMSALIVAGFVVTIGLVGWLSVPIRPLLPWWSIVVANVAAVLVGAAYLRYRRPGVLGRMLRPAR